MKKSHVEKEEGRGKILTKHLLCPKHCALHILFPLSTIISSISINIIISMWYMWKVKLRELTSLSKYSFFLPAWQ